METTAQLIMNEFVVLRIRIMLLRAVTSILDIKPALILLRKDLM